MGRVRREPKGRLLVKGDLSTAITFVSSHRLPDVPTVAANLTQKAVSHPNQLTDIWIALYPQLCKPPLKMQSGRE